MAFPAVTPTSQPQATALLGNNAATAGLTNTVPFDRLTELEQVVANLLTDVPAAISFGAANLLTTGNLGYTTGAGGAVTQATSKSTGVTLNKRTGQITMNAASLAAGAEVAFTLTNSTIAATSVVIPTIATGGTSASYSLSVTATAAGSCEITLTNLSGGALAEALVLNFVVIAGAAA